MLHLSLLLAFPLVLPDLVPPDLVVDGEVLVSLDLSVSHELDIISCDLSLDLVLSLVVNEVSKLVSVLFTLKDIEFLLELVLLVLISPLHEGSLMADHLRCLILAVDLPLRRDSELVLVGLSLALPLTLLEEVLDLDVVVVQLLECLLWHVALLVIPVALVLVLLVLVHGLVLSPHELLAEHVHVRDVLSLLVTLEVLELIVVLESLSRVIGFLLEVAGAKRHAGCLAMLLHVG